MPNTSETPSCVSPFIPESSADVKASSSTSAASGLGAATVAVSSTATSLKAPTLSPLTAVRRIETAWGHWKSALDSRRSKTKLGDSHIRTSYRPRVVKGVGGIKFSQSQRLGMINLTPIDGSGPTLSSYYRIEKDHPVLGQGSSASVLAAPRDCILRCSRYRGQLAPAQVNPSCYADLSSFLALRNLSLAQQVCLYAGQDLHQYLQHPELSLTISDFETVSAHLKALHERGLYHMDIKRENMACKIVNGKARLSFIDCDSITTAKRCAEAPSTFPRDILRPSTDPKIIPKGKPDDEYAFLLVLLAILDSSFVWTYVNLAKKPVSERVRAEMISYSTLFANQWVKPDHRLAVAKFISAPTDENALCMPLHDMIDWSIGQADNIS